MGEVWRATDTQLNRDVALKILPEAFASDPDRLARSSRLSSAVFAVVAALPCLWLLVRRYID